MQDEVKLQVSARFDAVVFKSQYRHVGIALLKGELAQGEVKLPLSHIFIAKFAVLPLSREGLRRIKQINRKACILLPQYLCLQEY